MKSLLNNRYIWKISSKRLASANWNMQLSRNDALKHNELVALASSSVLRMVDLANGEYFREKEKRIKKLKQEIDVQKTLKNTPQTREK